MANAITKTFDRLLRRRGPRLPYWHGTCSLDHRSAAEAERCRRTD